MQIDPPFRHQRRSRFCFLYFIFCILFSVFCFLYFVFCILFSVFCFLYFIFCILLSVFYFLLFYMEIDQILCIVLAAAYFLVTLLSFVQVIRIVYYGHSVISFQFQFLSIVFMLGGLRVVFFVQSNEWTEATILAIYWTPNVFQFTTFSLLLIFYVYHDFLLKRDRKGWNSSKRPIFIVWSILNLLFFILELGSIIFLCNSSCSDEPQRVLKFNHFIISLAYIILCCSFCIYSTRIYLTLANSDAEHPEFNRISFAFLSLMLVLVFISRCVYNFLAMYNVFSIIISDSHGYFISINWTAFVSFLFWELFPTSSILFYFRSIPTTKIGMIVLWLPRDSRKLFR